MEDARQAAPSGVRGILTDERFARDAPAVLVRILRMNSLLRSSALREQTRSALSA